MINRQNRSLLQGRAQRLVLREVHALYGLAHVLHGVSLEVRPGEVVALLGRNGAGKTTTLRAILGMVNVPSGRVSFGNEDITRWPPHRVARLGIAYVPEDRRLFPGLSVIENLRLAAVGGGIPKREVAAAIEHCWELFPELEAHARREAVLLSGGQQQMVAIARALVSQPSVLLVDEPTQGLAPLIAEHLMQALVDAAGSGVGILLVDQNAQLALSSAERAYVLDRGVVCLAGDAREILRDDVMRHQLLSV